MNFKWGFKGALFALIAGFVFQLLSGFTSSIGIISGFFNLLSTVAFIVAGISFLIGLSKLLFR